MTHANLIAGAFVAGHDAVADINPSDTSDVVGEYDRASAAQVEDAIAAARAAAPAWGRTTGQQRAEMLEKIGLELMARRAELADLLAREEGKTLAEAGGEVGRAGQIFKFFAGECLRVPGDRLGSVRPGIDVEITREPLGVVGLITPWNFPIAIPAWKIAPALAYGNCVVIKPAELVPGSAWALADIIHRAGIPAGVFNLVMGRGSVVGEKLVTDARIDAISFTGSVATGRGILEKAAKRGAKVQLEMGGKNPLVVLADADMDVAVRCALDGAFFQTGQRCTASSRLIVEQAVHRKFVDGLTEAIRKQVVDDARKQGTTIGPVVDQSQLDQDIRYIDIGQKEGAKLVIGGERLNREKTGFFLAPALFDATRNDMRINREEIFGPVASVIRRARLRRGAGGGERHEFRAVLGDRDDVAEKSRAFPPQRRDRHGDGEPADRRRRLPRAVRRPEGIELRLARTGPLCRGVLHAGQDGVRDAELSAVRSLTGTVRTCVRAARSCRDGRAAGTDGGGRRRRGRPGAWRVDGWRRGRRRPAAGRGAGGDRRRDGTRREQAGRRADAQHPAERTQDAAGLRGGGDEGCHLRIGQQMLQLRGAGRRLRHQTREPGEAPRQTARRRPGRARRWAAAGGRTFSGADPGGEDGEPDGQAAQPRPDQNHQRQGDPAHGAARGNGPAQPVDDAGEAVGRGGRSGGGHERNRNTRRPGWASAILRAPPLPPARRSGPFAGGHSPTGPAPLRR